MKTIFCTESITEVLKRNINTIEAEIEITSNKATPEDILRLRINLREFFEHSGMYD